MKFYSKQIHSSTSRHAQPPAPARDKTTPTPIYHIPRVDRLSFFRPPYFARWAQYVRLCRPISPVGLNTCACVALFRPLSSIRALVSPYFARWAQYVRLCRPISPVGLNTGSGLRLLPFRQYAYAAGLCAHCVARIRPAMARPRRVAQARHCLVDVN